MALCPPALHRDSRTDSNEWISQFYFRNNCWRAGEDHRGAGRRRASLALKVANEGQVHSTGTLKARLSACVTEWRTARQLAGLVTTVFAQFFLGITITCWPSLHVQNPLLGLITSQLNMRGCSRLLNMMAVWPGQPWYLSKVSLVL